MYKEIYTELYKNYRGIIYELYRNHISIMNLKNNLLFTLQLLHISPHFQWLNEL